MHKVWLKMLAVSSAMLALPVMQAAAQTVKENLEIANEPASSSYVQEYFQQSQDNNIVSQSTLGVRPSSNQAQVTSVSQLSDVQPTDWAFTALQSLVERYGCIAGYPDRTYRGQRAMTRYEFAAGLNACLDKINEIISSGLADKVSKEDLAALQRLQEEFAAELAALRGRVDALEAKTAQLEAQQFSTTTKLVGEAAMNLASAFGDDVDSNLVFQSKLRMTFVTSFTGKDRLYTRLTGGNIANSFADEIGTNEGRFAYDGVSGNTIILDRFHYKFPVGDKLEVTAMAGLAGHHFYANTLNQGLDVGGGANGAITRFAERNPIFRFDLGGQGFGFKYLASDKLEFSAGYIANSGSDPDKGLTGGSYSALANLVFKPTDRFSAGLTYVRAYDEASGRRFNFGGTGTNFANLSSASGLPDIVTGSAVSSNSYGFQTKIDFSPRFSLRGWVGFTDAELRGVGSADILNYAIAMVFPDLFKEGSSGALIVGAAPYLTSLDAPGDPEFSEETPFHIEAFYKYRVSKNITVTPAIVWLTSPDQGRIDNDAFIGTVRTTFSF
ncbi:cyanobacterial porin [Thalassoporum mexicanum PCC 7367]|uniref:iron uptake porin n=1 Tax=Thalassoporum mexicanum TaxID=3457544 RepID=UPI00029FF235|nr:iron uptake porin [Pseudanabaena sp. PCC 7367]AFY68799.1 cyanobacterial porin [Pseudanabaena sp. PCC 7367]